MNYYPELTELAEIALSKVLADRENLVITRGIVVAELLTMGQDDRSVLAVQFGRQGVIPPYDVLGLLAPVEMSARRRISLALGGGDG